MTVYRSRKISEFDADASLSGTEQFIVAQDGSNYRVTVEQVRAFIDDNLENYLPLIGGVMCAEGSDPETVGIAVTLTPADGLDITPVHSNKMISLHLDSPSSANGGVALGKALSRIPIKSIGGGVGITARGGDDFNATLSGSWASAKVNVNEADPQTITIQTNNDDAEDWQPGDYFTVCQIGVGQVTVALESGTLRIPADLLCKTRAQYACITLTCDDPAGPTWTASGELAAA